MKKIVLLVASILATLHSIASRSGNDSNNPLILSPSDGIYNHGSHASHASHRSHYSMTGQYGGQFYDSKADSIKTMSMNQQSYFIDNMINYHHYKEIEIKHAYLTNHYSIIQDGSKPIEISQELAYFIRFTTENGGMTYIIPLDNKKKSFHMVSNKAHCIYEKPQWIIQLTQMKE